MSEVIIEKGFPVPVSRERGRWGATLSRMVNGDSFVCTITEEQAVRAAAKVQKCVVTVRRINGDSVRVWLVSRAPKA